MSGLFHSATCMFHISWTSLTPTEVGIGMGPKDYIGEAVSRALKQVITRKVGDGMEYQRASLLKGWWHGVSTCGMVCQRASLLKGWCVNVPVYCSDC